MAVRIRSGNALSVHMPAPADLLDTANGALPRSEAAEDAASEPTGGCQTAKPTHRDHAGT
ncbi:hypothetical protein [Nonomuraea jiangxiensis]|nr:hypothetical protein [Nonomuraea jiangxiensis]